MLYQHCSVRARSAPDLVKCPVHTFLALISSLLRTTMLAFSYPRWRTAFGATNLAANNDPGLKLGKASLITPNIFLSDYYTARDEKELIKLGITHVVSVLEHDPVIPKCIPEKNKLRIQIMDRPDVDILPHLERTTEFLRLALEEPMNKVLVHCFQGVSRSATVVCAYLTSTGMSAKEAVKFVKSKRGIRQLEIYAKRYANVSQSRRENTFSRNIKKLKISDGVAERIRWLKGKGAEPVEVQEVNK
ncbi:protein-tyrosine phosphatase-like protein [Desarmillaria tabescens]|uniref:protein-serine/threonine phosphatase n=1 Tax=Armillaria tabescens TaxID=1929756 RepID=A0AA39NKE7_ARMTA|nr:protein-tyrosine phosphatase-like protein [Desarmillaria tabescens]KAK0467225.1 protein-tyrosine phosphatase-like protein [Desarmillaria tabescens]